ncbi:MAG: DegT/DnrJ/EryC1/StrS aminotransferase family protein [Rhodocyclaceae bacterium]|nr:MAG: DegT/DnrJ/EryC1/StrS aminotransferase family protein [Rhodocyclaceae bacterium]
MAMTTNPERPARLAVEGGQAVRQTPFGFWPVHEQDEISAAMAVLESGRVNYWTGNECTAFEREFAGFIGCDHAISLANGTVALELGLRALGIGAGDEVVVPSRTFIASASCAVAVGARPVVADVDPESGNLNAGTVREVLSPRTRAIVAVHLAGWPCDMDSILALARERGIAVVEDCAQAHGAVYKGRVVGSFGDCAAFSFCQDKIMSTGGEGGMLVMRDAALWERAWSYKDHGKSYDAVFNRQHPPGFRWLHDSFGSNYRMTEMQAAIGRVQLRKLPAWLARRRSNADRLTQAFETVPGLRTAMPAQGLDHACYKLYVYLVPERLRSGWDQRRIVEAIAAEGVPCFSGSCSEIYLENAFIKSGFCTGARLPVASDLGETSLMFLVHPTLCEADMDDTIAAVRKVMSAAALP